MKTMIVIDISFLGENILSRKKSVKIEYFIKVSGNLRLQVFLTVTCQKF
jgi:hypothetical protein